MHVRVLPALVFYGSSRVRVVLDRYLHASICLCRVPGPVSRDTGRNSMPRVVFFFSSRPECATGRKKERGSYGDKKGDVSCALLWRGRVDLQRVRLTDPYAGLLSPFLGLSFPLSVERYSTSLSPPGCPLVFFSSVSFLFLSLLLFFSRAACLGTSASMMHLTEGFLNNRIGEHRGGLEPSNSSGSEDEDSSSSSSSGSRYGGEGERDPSSSSSAFALLSTRPGEEGRRRKSQQHPPPPPPPPAAAAAAAASGGGVLVGPQLWRALRKGGGRSPDDTQHPQHRHHQGSPPQTASESSSSSLPQATNMYGRVSAYLRESNLGPLAPKTKKNADG